MKIFKFLLAFFILAGMLLSTSGIALAGQEGLKPLDVGGGPPEGVVPDHYIVLLQDGASAENIARDHGLAPGFFYQKVFNGFAGFVPPGKVKALREDARVKAVYLDRQVSVVLPLGKPSGGKTNVQVTPPNIDRVRGSATQTGQSVGIAIVDTGVDLANRDLNVGTAYYDAFGGNGQDKNGHGTHVAGIAAALNNTYDVVGVAPAATVYSVRVLDASGFGADSSVIAGLDWIALNAAKTNPPVRVANASLGRMASTDDTALRIAVQGVVSAGVIFITAAGNDPSIEVSQFVPAGFPESVAVASTTAVDGSNAYRGYTGVIKADTASYFTTDGSAVKVSTPGEEKEDITRAGFISSVGILSLKLGGGTTRMSGTSMAAPHVAGLAALLIEESPTATVTDIRTRLTCPNTDRDGIAPFNSPTGSYTYDGLREGIGYAPEALAAAP